MQKVKVNKQLLISSLLVAAVIFEFFILIPWGVKRIIDFNRKTASLKHQIKTTQSEWPRLNQYLEEKERIDQQIQSRQSRFVLSQEASKSLSFISAASKQFGVETKSFLPGELQVHPSPENQNMFFLPIRIKAKGKFHNLARLLNYLQNSQYFFDVKELEITSQASYNLIEMILWAIVEKK